MDIQGVFSPPVINLPHKVAHISFDLIPRPLAL